MQPEFKQVPKDDITNFVGLRRSGNHAVIDWIFGHCKSWIHYNNCVLHEDGGAESASYVAQSTPEYAEKGVFYSLASFEDYDLSYIEEHLSEPRVLLLRDPFNMFASRLQNVRNFNKKEDATFCCLDMVSDRGFEMWKRYARAFLENNQFVKIDFNRWFSSVDYRQDTSNRLGFTFSDKKFGSKRGWRHSGGSSFGSKPDPLNSYKNLSEDEEYLSLFDEETLDLCRQVGYEVPNLNFCRPDGYHESIAHVLSEVERMDSEVSIGVLEQSLKVYTQSTILRQHLEFIKRNLHKYHKVSY